MIKPQMFKAEVVSNDEIASMTMHMRLKPKLENKFEFEAGQFVTIVVGPMIRRSYSIGNVPGSEYIDLIADYKLGGPGSMFFKNTLAGAEVDLLGPLGQFTFKAETEGAIFWSTGTGIVPFLSMIEDALRNKNYKGKITLNSGFRHLEEAIYKDQMEKLASEFSNFTYNLYLSQPDETWTGKKGRITEFLNDFTPTGEGHYLCGAQKMISSVVELLEAKGVEADKIHYEKYY